MDKEFEDMCMKKRMKEIEASAVKINNPVEIDKLIRSHKKLGSYFLTGARSIIDSESPLLAVLLGYFAMEQKAYENRLEVNYLGNIDTIESDKNRAKKFLEGTVLVFISEIEKLMDKK